MLSCDIVVNCLAKESNTKLFSHQFQLGEWKEKIHWINEKKNVFQKTKTINGFGFISMGVCVCATLDAQCFSAYKIKLTYAKANETKKKNKNKFTLQQL